MSAPRPAAGARAGRGGRRLVGLLYARTPQGPRPALGLWRDCDGGLVALKILRGPQHLAHLDGEQGVAVDAQVLAAAARAGASRLEVLLPNGTVLHVPLSWVLAHGRPLDQGHGCQLFARLLDFDVTPPGRPR